MSFAAARVSIESCWFASIRQLSLGHQGSRGRRCRGLYGDLPACRLRSQWLEPEQKIFECSCHYSHYNPREGASVMGGPATRPLAALPLKIAEGKLVVAKPFTGRVGIISD